MKNILYCSSLGLLLFTGCNPTNSVEDAFTPNLPFNQIMPIDKQSNTKLELKTSLPSSKHLYLAFSNPSDSDLSSSLEVSAIQSALQLQTKKPLVKKRVFTPLRMERSDILYENNHPHLETSSTLYTPNYLLTAPRATAVGTAETLQINSSSGSTVNSTVRATYTSSDGITLNILVDDTVWDSGSGCSKAFCVTQAMVDALLDKFLNNTQNDIYHWVTNIIGAPWGTHSYNNLIDSSKANTIDILLLDIDNDNSTDGGVLGYFWSKDNYLASSVTGSNERLMFYMDSVMLANPSNDGTDSDTTWSITDYWPDYLVSTLAHEFQHMIHFYQKAIKRGASSNEAWEDEMASMMIEDLLSDKLNTLGPRGVLGSDYSEGSSQNSKGRIPLYNYYPSLTVAEASNFGLSHYSSSYAFGAYLLRNFEGANFLKAQVQNAYGSKQAITEALSSLGYSETFDTVLQKCATAIILSDQKDMPQGYRFNQSDTTAPFLSRINGIDYNLGSINFFNYDRYYYTNLGPNIDNSKLSQAKESRAMMFYDIGVRQGDISVTVNLPELSQATLIAK